MRSVIDFDKVYESNHYGKYKILKEIEPKVYESGLKIRMVEVIFLDTGTIVQTRLSTATGSHAIKDNYYPKIHNVACIGDSHMVYDKLYKAWNDMINRCYNPKNKSYKNYGAVGIAVCKEWLCYENFIRDAVDLDGFYEYINFDNYQLDKDILQKSIPDNKKVYSKETCCFIPMKDNKFEELERNRNIDKFVGVKQVSDNKFVSRITHNGEEIYLGTFDAPQYAAEIFDYYARLYDHKLMNNLGINIGESLQHRIGNNPVNICKKVMCKIIDQNQKL